MDPVIEGIKYGFGIGIGVAIFTSVLYFVFRVVQWWLGPVVHRRTPPPRYEVFEPCPHGYRKATCPICKLNL